MNEREVKRDITEEEMAFLDDFLKDELTEEGLKELDMRLMDSDFKHYYEKRLDEKYNKSVSKLIADYMPMIIMLILVVLGIYLFMNSN